MRLIESCFRLRSDLLKAGVVGVGGNVEAVRDGEYDFAARCDGRKMPAPGTDVVKYRML